jgi:hypothetical protein
MDILMTIHTEVFPVGPVEWVVVMIAVLVMNGEKMSCRLIKFPSAPSTYKAVEG